MYKQEDKGLLKNVCKTKFNKDGYIGPYIGLYVITAVRNNGNIRARKGKLMDTFNIRNLTP